MQLVQHQLPHTPQYKSLNKLGKGTIQQIETHKYTSTLCTWAVTSGQMTASRNICKHIHTCKNECANEQELCASSPSQFHACSLAHNLQNKNGVPFVFWFKIGQREFECLATGTHVWSPRTLSILKLIWSQKLIRVVWLQIGITGIPATIVGFCLFFFFLFFSPFLFFTINSNRVPQNICGSFLLCNHLFQYCYTAHFRILYCNTGNFSHSARHFISAAWDTLRYLHTTSPSLLVFFLHIHSPSPQPSTGLLPHKITQTQCCWAFSISNLKVAYSTHTHTHTNTNARSYSLDHHLWQFSLTKIISHLRAEPKRQVSSVSLCLNP